ncbi:MAG: ubiquinol-cytochrome c reductase iron-sulfur subunit [Actinomycetota bacterium]
MDSSTALVLALAAVLLLAGVMVIATGRRRAGTGRLDRETKRADASPAAASTELATTPKEEVVDRDAEARARADEARGALEPTGGRGVAERVPVDEEELGVTRRQFFNRGILTGLGLSISSFGVASLAFLWPTKSGGLGQKIPVGSLAQIKEAFDKKIPYYNATAKTYIVAYPKEDLDKAKKVYPPNIVKGMEQGYVALSQKCPHLGCRVPWCITSQWFECPCHGSKYNRVGEKRGGPAPRGMDRWPLEVSGGGIEVDTAGTVVTGPPIGTDTTGQGAEGAPCV